MKVAVMGSEVFSTEADRKKLLSRLARVEGQLRGVRKMIESGKDCELVAQQLAAARGALNKAFYELIACALETRLGSACNSGLQEQLSGLASLLVRYG